MGFTLSQIGQDRYGLEVTRPVRRVTPAELREAFNAGRYYERVVANELIATVESERPARPEANRNQPAGSISQMVWYYDMSFQRLALVHQYLRRDAPRRLWKARPEEAPPDEEILFC